MQKPQHSKNHIFSTKKKTAEPSNHLIYSTGAGRNRSGRETESHGIRNRVLREKADDNRRGEGEEKNRSHLTTLRAFLQRERERAEKRNPNVEKGEGSPSLRSMWRVQARLAGWACSSSSAKRFCSYSMYNVLRSWLVVSCKVFEKEFFYI